MTSTPNTEPTLSTSPTIRNKSETKPALLLLIPLKPAFVERLQQDWTLLEPQGGVKSPALATLDLTPVQAIVTNGSSGASVALMQRMPQLKIVCCFGAGYEGVDLAYTREHGIALSNAPGVNDDTVADHALGLMLTLARGYPQLDRAVREGRFASARDERPTLSGARLGMLGLGNIGMKIAQRAAAFGMSIAYCTRKPRPDLGWRHYADAIALAQAVDWLVVATPGGAATRHLVNAAVLQALGAKGWLVNISRGSVVDEAALIAALRDGVIAGAGLDVYADEPDINPALLALPNTVFTPHMAGRSPQAQQAQMDLLLANLQACFEGRALPSAVN